MTFGRHGRLAMLRNAAALGLAGLSLSLAPAASAQDAAGKGGRCAGQKNCESRTQGVPIDPALPAYVPKGKLTGKLRIFGSPLGGQVEAWAAEFKKFHPEAVFDNAYPSSDAAAGALTSNIADIASTGREANLAEFLAFYEVFQYDLTEVAVASGTFNIRGRTPSVVVYVNKDNPLAHMTVDQVDGVFGSMRSGGYDGYIWRPENGRGADKDIRTWGQLGLTGEWADKPIHTHGYANTGMTGYFQRAVFKGGDKWAPNYQQYTESFTKMVPNGDYGPGSSQYMLSEIAKDKYAIGWSFIPQQERMKSGEVKAIELGTDPKGPFYAPNLANTLSRNYPLTRSVFFYLKKPKAGLDPNVMEFMRFVMSREGQQSVASMGIYLPLPAKTAAAELAKLQ